MDLRTHVPRSPFAELHGYAWLPRMIDKARATAAGTSGDYQFNCPMDQKFLAFYGLQAWALFGVIAGGASDARIARYVARNATAHGLRAEAGFRQQFLWTAPSGSEARAHRKEVAESRAPGQRDLISFAQLIALEEGHPLPILAA
ncbi:MAG: DUF5069 domain-containing protein [Candidatus Sericytochromatia bacterium]|nr:DUF5069 domain-containing protein [Candidatus Sericytochromatia bacterium]